jgi:hypothetical protein
MSTPIPSPRGSLRATRTRGFGRLVLTEGKVWIRGSDLFWAPLFPTVLLLGQAGGGELRRVIGRDRRQRASGRDARLTTRTSFNVAACRSAGTSPRRRNVGAAFL